MNESLYRDRGKLHKEAPVQHTDHQGIKLKFINVQPEVLNVLRVTRLEEFLLG